MARREQGYILLYVLGVLLVLSMLALTVAYKQRVGFQLVLNAKERAQSSLVLRSAAEYTGAQLIKATMLDGLVRAKDTSVEGIRLWQGNTQQEVTISDDVVLIELTEQIQPPNLNLFDEKELQRLFTAMGAREGDALNYAQALLKIKPKEGFTPNDLVGVKIIPTRFLIGDGDDVKGERAPKKEGEEKAPVTVGLMNMISLTGNSKKIDLNQTPLELVSALTNLSLDKLGKLAALRRKGNVSRDAAIEAIGPEIAAFLAAPDSVRAVLTLPERPEWAEVIYKQQGRWKIEQFKQHEDGNPADSRNNNLERM